MTLLLPSTEETEETGGCTDPAQLLEALSNCARSYDAVLAVVDETEPMRTRLLELWAAWSDYYWGAFGRFDAALRACVRLRVSSYPRFLPVSISSHNLHRLLQALQAEIGDQSLAETRVSERVQDLVVVTRQLRELLAATVESRRPALT